MPERCRGRARIAVLISGEGRNLAALIDACADGRVHGEIVLVVSNRAEANGLVRAHAAGVATCVVPHVQFANRQAFEDALISALDDVQPDIVALAGFMRILTPAFVHRYCGRLLNIHPSLLPRHPGLDTHRRVLQAGDAEHGATVHFVTQDLDGGPAIIQGRVRVDAHDTAQTLSEKVMQDVELRIYPQALAWMAEGVVALDRGLALWNGQIMESPVQWNVDSMATLPDAAVGAHR